MLLCGGGIFKVVYFSVGFQRTRVKAIRKTRTAFTCGRLNSSIALFRENRERNLRYGIQTMNICKADAIAQLSKWYNAATTVRAIFRSVTGNTLIVGTMSELSLSIFRIRGDECEMVLYFRDDHGNGLAFVLSQAAGMGIGLESQLFSQRPDPFPCFAAHLVAVAQCAGHG